MKKKFIFEIVTYTVCADLN